MIFQNTLDKTTKIGNNRMTNPWDVDSLQAFLTLKCPECDFCTDTETLFQAHAVANHPLCLSNLLKKIDKFSGAALKGDNNFFLLGMAQNLWFKKKILNSESHDLGLLSLYIF